MPNPNSKFIVDERALDWLKETKILDNEVDFLNQHIRLPHDVEIITNECGVANAFYKPNITQIEICYEFIDNIWNLWLLFNDETGNLDRIDEFKSSVVFATLYHEIGHALIDIYNLPITGLEENVADQFSALMMIEYVAAKDDSATRQKMLSYIMDYYRYQDQWWNKLCPSYATTDEAKADCEFPYWSQHGTDIQRYYNYACYLYGSDPESNQHLVDDNILPEARHASCGYEYYQIYFSWEHLLDRFTDDLLDLKY